MIQSETYKNATLATISTLMALLMLEIGYRAFLYYDNPAHFRQAGLTAVEHVSYFSQSPYQLSERHGYDYKPNFEFIIGGIAKGRPAGCGLVRTNQFGGWGVAEGDYESADIKIMVLGDSFTVSAPQGVTWAHVLQEIVSKETNKRAVVRNLARDGQGVLQMLDIAADHLHLLKPNLIIFGYITDNLTRDRIWRREEVVDGRLRVFTSAAGGKEFDLRRAVDTVVINPDPKLTLQWCQDQSLGADRPDPMIQEIEQRHRIAVDHANARADLFTAARSYVVDTIRYGDPFHYYLYIRQGAAHVNPRHSLQSFADEVRTKENMRLLRESGVPIVLFHLATRSELRADEEFVLLDPRRQLSLIRSLEAGLGVRSIFTSDNVTLPIVNLEDIGVSPTDDHPGRAGVEMYGKAAFEGMKRYGLIERLLGRSNTAIVLNPDAPVPPLGSATDEYLRLGEKTYRIVGRIGGAVESMAESYRRITIRGWAGDQTHNKPAIRIVASVSGNVIAEATPTDRRPDIEQGLGNGISPAGFHLPIAIPKSDGTELAVVRVYAVMADGTAVRLASQLAPGATARVDPMPFPAP